MNESNLHPDWEPGEEEEKTVHDMVSICLEVFKKFAGKLPEPSCNIAQMMAIDYIAAAVIRRHFEDRDDWVEAIVQHGANIQHVIQGYEKDQQEKGH